MIYSPPAEIDKLIYRFIRGDLPLFVCEQWLQDPDIRLQLPAGLRTALEPYWQNPAQTSEQRRQQLLMAFQPGVDQGQYQSWLLLEILPLILNEDPRACLALQQAVQLYHQQGLTFLKILAQAFRSGEGSAHFDWNPVRAAIPHLKPICRLLLRALHNGEITFDQQSFQVSQDLYALLYPDSDWRRANQTIRQWEQTQN